MVRHVVYEVTSQTSPTLTMVTPVDVAADYFAVDTRQYRGSTNFVQFYGALLGMGHRRVRTPPPVAYLYYHYWYAFCPDAPYRAAAKSDNFLLPEDPSVIISYALGLAFEGRQHLYVSWSETDSAPRLTRYSPEQVLESFRNSSFAQWKGNGEFFGKDKFTNFSALCA
jgi:hypothetical protein